MIPSLLARVGLPILINIVAEALGTVDTPVTKGASEALKKVDLEMKSGGITKEQIAEANRHTETMATLQMEQNKAAISEINQSLRAEIVSEDEYVRRMRPTFGYLMAITWAAQMLGIAYVIVFDTPKAVLVMNAMGNLSAIWAVGLSVLGIYVYKRSEEKKQTSTKNGKDVIYWNE